LSYELKLTEASSSVTDHISISIPLNDYRGKQLTKKGNLTIQGGMVFEGYVRD
jgi:hypothetical protein